MTAAFALLCSAALAAQPAPPKDLPADAPPFEAAFPQKPIKELVEQKVHLASDRDVSLMVHRVSVQQDTGMYVVSFFKIPPTLFQDVRTLGQEYGGKADEAAMTQQLVDEMVSGVARALGGRVDRREQKTLKDGVEVDFGGPLLERDKKTVAGVFAARTVRRGQWIFTVLSAAAPDEDGKKLTQAFVNTFRFTDAR